MEEIRELKERLEGERPVEWEALPDIGLYMDQLISYMPRQLIRYGEGESLTSAAVLGLTTPPSRHRHSPNDEPPPRRGG